MYDPSDIQEIWNILSEYIPAKERQVAADHLVPILYEMEFTTSDFKSLVESNEYLCNAADAFISEDEDEDELDGETW